MKPYNGIFVSDGMFILVWCLCLWLLWGWRKILWWRMILLVKGGLLGIRKRIILPFNIVVMAHKPLLCHQHVHHSRITINDLITSYYHTIPEPEPQIIPLLSSTGFQHIALIKQCRIDLALITALVERWRPETHTFHLPWVECTTTLKDVTLHLGIRCWVTSVRWSPTSGRRGKVEHHISEEKTHKPEP